MSYKNKKKKEKLSNRIVYTMRFVRIVLLQLVRVIIPNKGRKENAMLLPQTRKVMQVLRERATRVRPNNKKIDTWVDEYVDRCCRVGARVDILTQWCLSKDLESRRESQGGALKTLKSEVRLIKEVIPAIISLFTQNGIGVNWWFTCNLSFLDRGRISPGLADEYMNMVRDLIGESVGIAENSIVLDWEQDVLGERPKPSKEVLGDFAGKVSQKAFEIDFRNLLERVKKYPNFSKTEEELQTEAKYKIACEAEEGRFLVSSDSPFPQGEFILVPLEFPERYVFFETLASGFQKRIVAIVKPYPWRMDADALTYEL